MAINVCNLACTCPDEGCHLTQHIEGQETGSWAWESDGECITTMRSAYGCKTVPRARFKACPKELDDAVCEDGTVWLSSCSPAGY